MPHPLPTPFTFAQHTGLGTRLATLALVGGTLDQWRITVSNADGVVDATAATPLFTIALIGPGQFTPLQHGADGTRHRVTTAEVTDDPRARTVEVYAFTGVRRETRFLLPALKVPVFAHVDTRPLRVLEREDGTYLEAA